MVLTNFMMTKRRKMSGKNYKLLYKRILDMKNNIMMEEPCPLYEPIWEDVTDSPADWEDFWNSEDIT